MSLTSGNFFCGKLLIVCNSKADKRFKFNKQQNTKNVNSPKLQGIHILEMTAFISTHQSLVKRRLCNN
jgi:hypothetical protein